MSTNSVSSKIYPRADHVGSLLRPRSIKTAREELGKFGALARFGTGTTPARLKQVEDEEIIKIVAYQEDRGLPVVTDGEFRRAYWHYDFMVGLNGLDLVERTSEDNVGSFALGVVPVIVGPLSFPSDHPMIGHFKYLAATAKNTPKISIPGPSACHFRLAKEDIQPDQYRSNPDALFADIAKTYKQAVDAFYAAGCRYLQMDDIFFAYLCDPKVREARKAGGEDPDALIKKYAWMMNEAIKDRPADMTIGMHLCRGNFQSTWVAQGAYDPAADAIFNQTDVDVYFLEYDSERAGGLEPLRLLPKGSKRVLPGFITTKAPELERLDDLKRKFDEAAKYADIGQLGIAPQCGFSSTEEGNKITMDDQKRKLELVVTTAEAIWGGVAD
ncbi:MAG: 5-methyltetrahydropteroyltriglutamate--homocysteine S-methyltransferase [Hyphomicrobiaceae bacterium]